MESDFHTRSVSQDESQSIADEILARRIKNRDRQRRYRRKRLEADMQRSCLMEGRVFWTAETISNVSSSNIESHESIVQPEMQGSLIHSAYCSDEFTAAGNGRRKQEKYSSRQLWTIWHLVRLLLKLLNQ
ncbi:hypothetical protein HPP92_014455 [Vanilla planifolia]|uniref:Uncharacterized protein n=1 Tax=Vanilla planifolia TaxID=51239 RepID=A0A835QLG0_VANPL|nr:hypothetical protein HPP92_014455 [Vanilla planifolia]